MDLSFEKQVRCSLDLCQFKNQVELQFGFKIKSSQSDWGGKFRAFSDLVLSSGIVHCTSCPYTYEQNGIAERKHRHRVENGLTLLARSSLPFKFWDEAFRIAVFLHNRLPSSVTHGKSPLEILFHPSPDCESLRVFGCACYPNIRLYNIHKLAYRSIQCFFLGYSLTHIGYKCLDPTVDYSSLEM